MSEIYKIIFLGLDFAGKTSILKILEGSYSGLDKIKPTLGPKRTAYDILGFKIMNWDLINEASQIIKKGMEKTEFSKINIRDLSEFYTEVFDYLKKLKDYDYIYKKEKKEIIKAIPKDLINFLHLTQLINSFSKSDRSMKDVFIIDRRDDSITNTIIAKKGRFILSPEARRSALRPSY